jgi:hypothetical protein
MQGRLLLELDKCTEAETKFLEALSFLKELPPGNIDKIKCLQHLSDLHKISFRDKNRNVYKTLLEEELAKAPEKYVGTCSERNRRRKRNKLITKVDNEKS